MVDAINAEIFLTRRNNPAAQPSYPGINIGDGRCTFPPPLRLTAMSAQSTGSCRDLNFDPLILPTGIAPSADPILAARSGVYAHSFNRRQWEIARGKASNGEASP